MLKYKFLYNIFDLPISSFTNLTTSSIYLIFSIELLSFFISKLISFIIDLSIKTFYDLFLKIQALYNHHLFLSLEFF